MSRTTLFVTAVAFTLVIILCVSAYSYKVLRRRRSASWQSLIGRLERVDRASIALLAHDLNSAPGDASDSDLLDADQIWTLSGGMEGLAAMEANCEVFVDLAFHLQERFPDALPAAESLRLQAREIKWQVDRLRNAAKTGQLPTSFPDYAQRAAATYYSMTDTLLRLYERFEWSQLRELESIL